MNIDITFDPIKEDINFLTNKINAETKDYGVTKPFACFIKNGQEEIIAGANGFMLYGKIYTDQLWVDKNYRKKGLATNIMDKVHELGKDNGCRMSTLSTMSFQNSLGFYKKLGYQIDFERAGHANNSSCLFLSKEL